MTSLSLNSVRPGCRPGGVGITPALLSAGLPVDAVLCVRPVFTAFPRSPLSPSDGAALAGCHSHRISLSLFSSLQGRPFPRGAGQRGRRRDVLQQGKPVAAGHSVAWMHCESCLNILCFLLQKRTWESNKNDIRICRMKGKHEVRRSNGSSGSSSTAKSHSSILRTSHRQNFISVLKFHRVDSISPPSFHKSINAPSFKRSKIPGGKVSARGCF